MYLTTDQVDMEEFYIKFSESVGMTLENFGGDKVECVVEYSQIDELGEFKGEEERCLIGGEEDF